MASLCAIAPLAEASLAAGFCAGVVPVEIDQARSIVAVGVSDFVTLERGTGSVLLVEDLDGDDDGIPEWSIRTLVSSASGLNHGLAVTTTHLYASRDTEVYRWPYDPITRSITAGDRETVIENISADGQGGAPGGHTTRTLAFHEATSELYVSVGSNKNIDPDSYRSRIRRFVINNDTLFPIDFALGEVFVDGLRNEVAMEFAPDGVLWGAGNSADRLVREVDLGGDIHNDNPAEEVHRLLAGQNYGYPFCWREYELEGSGQGRGTAWAWPSFLNTEITDQECRDNYDTPVLAMQAHSAPLGITFYQYQENRPPECNNVAPFPVEMDGDAFVAFHGSWNRDIPTGYKVVRLPITEDGTGVVGGIGADPIDLLKHEGSEARWADGFRPVDVSFDQCGRLLVSSDGSRNIGDYAGSKIVRIESTAALPSPAPAAVAPFTVAPSEEADPSMTTPDSTSSSEVPTEAPIEAPGSTLSSSSSPEEPAVAPTTTTSGGDLPLPIIKMSLQILGLLTVVYSCW